MLGKAMWGIVGNDLLGIDALELYGRDAQFIAR